MARAELESAATELFAKPVQEREKPSQRSAHAAISLRKAAIHDAALESFLESALTFDSKPLIKISPERPRPARMLQLAQRLGLDLPDALASDRERIAYFLQRMVAGHSEAEPHANNTLFAGREGCQDFRDRIPQT